jgi:hypothetical protein
MASVAQSTYLMPRERVGSFIDALAAVGLIDGGSTAKEEEFFLPLGASKENFHPALSCWPGKKDEPLRRMDIHWLVGQESIVEKVERIALQHSARCG